MIPTVYNQGLFINHHTYTGYQVPEFVVIMLVSVFLIFLVISFGVMIYNMKRK